MRQTDRIRSLLVRSLSYGLIWFLVASCAVRPKEISRREYNNVQQRMDITFHGKENYYLYREASLWLGTPYRYGGCSIRGIDCSCFVSTVYQSVYGKRLQRNTHDMYIHSCRRISRNRLREGDLLFFKNNPRSKRFDHVGIYLKNGKFVHASTSRGVMVSSLHEEYYRTRFKAAGRVK